MKKTSPLDEIIERVNTEKRQEASIIYDWERWVINSLNSIKEQLEGKGWNVEADYGSSRPTLNISMGRYIARVAYFWQQRDLSYLPPDSFPIRNKGWRGIFKHITTIEKTLKDDAYAIARVYGI